MHRCTTLVPLATSPVLVPLWHPPQCRIPTRLTCRTRCETMRSRNSCGHLRMGYAAPMKVAWTRRRFMAHMATWSIEFLSPYFNRREDKWGGSRENRARFALAIIEAARTMVGPDFPLGIRVGIEGDGLKRGLTIEELVETSRLLAPHVEYISVSGGSYSGFGDGVELAYVSPWYREPGFNVTSRDRGQAAVDVPVIVTGRVADASLAESILAEGGADMIGMVRALIADPELPKKARAGRVDEIRMCVGMSECHAIGPHRVPVTCAVNAAAAREAEMEITPSDVQKTVVIVGAGPAGMEAARVAALRGHRVYLADARSKDRGHSRRASP